MHICLKTSVVVEIDSPRTEVPKPRPAKSGLQTSLETYNNQKHIFQSFSSLILYGISWRKKIWKGTADIDTQHPTLIREGNHLGIILEPFL